VLDFAAIGKKWWQDGESYRAAQGNRGNANTNGNASGGKVKSRGGNPNRSKVNANVNTNVNLNDSIRSSAKNIDGDRDSGSNDKGLRDIDQRKGSISPRKQRAERYRIGETEYLVE